MNPNRYQSPTDYEVLTNYDDGKGDVGFGWCFVFNKSPTELGSSVGRPASPQRFDFNFYLAAADRLFKQTIAI